MGATKDILRDLWSDSKHWKLGMVYSCPDDPRMFVPMRVRGTGYAINFSHKSAFPTLIGITLAPMIPFASVLVWEPLPALIVSFTSFILIIAALTFLCHWEATRDRSGNSSGK